jgi:hypothetical protein
MDASKQANRKGDQTKRGGDDAKGDVKQAGEKGRYEGGNDSDQDRQAAKPGRQDEKAPVAPETPFGRHGSEEE